MTGRLAGKIAIITGSSSGLGRAIAVSFAREGAQVCCVDLYATLRNHVDPFTGKADSYHNRSSAGQPTHELLKSDYTGDHVFVSADCTKADDLEAAISKCVEHFGRLDIMCNNAGISVESTHSKVTRIHETSEDDYDKTMAINTKGVFLGCKYAIGQMLKQEKMFESRGWIINTASVQGYVGYYGTRTYSRQL